MKRASLILPTFIGCGVPKAGSTTLWKLLSLHPEIGMSRRKEIYFFVQEGDRICGVTVGGGHANYTKGLGWYAEHFGEFADRRERGEISPWYFASPEVRLRIKQDLPQVKLLFVLRDPVERMYSYFREHQRHYWGPRKETLRDFAQVEQSKWLLTYVCLSEYYHHLVHWYEDFGEDRILIILFDDLKQDQLKVLNDIARFLKISELKELPLSGSEVSARSSVPVHAKKGRSLRWRFLAPLEWWYSKVLPETVQQRIRIPQQLRKVLYKSEIHSIDQEVRRRLIGKYFYEDIDKLQRLIKRDLSKWLQ